MDSTMRMVAGAAIGLAVAGSGGAAAPACVVETAASLPLLLRGGHLFVAAQIAGTPVELLVDTGAAISVLDRSVARRLKLRDAGERGRLVGITGHVEPSRSVRVPGFSLGPLALPAQSFVESDLGRGRPPALRIGGILGSDVLARFDLEVDSAAGRMALHRVAGCGPAFRPWPDSVALPLTSFQNGGLNTVPVRLGGQELAALLDTGATQSVIFAEGAKRLGAAARPDPADGTGYGLGVAPGQRVGVRLHRFAALSLGALTIDKPVLAVAGTDPLGLAMVLGWDVLGRQRFWLSRATERLFLAPNPSAARN